MGSLFTGSLFVGLLLLGFPFAGSSLIGSSCVPPLGVLRYSLNWLIFVLYNLYAFSIVFFLAIVNRKTRR